MSSSCDWSKAALVAAILPLCLAACGDDPLATREDTGELQVQLKEPSGAEAEEGETLYACYRPGSGGVYRVNSPESPGAEPRLKDGCTSHAHVLFSWNEQGPQGERGEKGEKGDKGDPGDFRCRVPGGASSGAAVGTTSVTLPTPSSAALATDPFIGEVILFAGNFAPRGWAFAEGQLMPIPQNQALFSILGTTYGGDGRLTFALPDMRGLEPVCGMHYIIALVGVFPSRN